MMFTDSIVQKEGLGLDKAVEEVKYRYASRPILKILPISTSVLLMCFCLLVRSMARCTSCSTHSSTALASHFYDTVW